MDRVHEVSLVYDRVKFRNTKQKRRVLSSKNPRASVNYGRLETFTENAVMRDVIPGFFFESLYANGKKLSTWKPECRFLNSKAILNHYAGFYMPQRIVSYSDIVQSITLTKENISIYLFDYEIEIPQAIYTHDPLKRLIYSDFALMVKLGMISGYLLFLHEALHRFFDFLPPNIDIEKLNSTYRHYNRDGKIDKLLSALFKDIKPESRETK